MPLTRGNWCSDLHQFPRCLPSKHALSAMPQEQIYLTVGQVSNVVAFLRNYPDAPEEVSYLCFALTGTLSHGVHILLSYAQEEVVHSPSFLPTPLPTPPSTSSNSYPGMPSGLTSLSEHQTSALHHGLERVNQQVADNQPQAGKPDDNVPDANCPREGRHLNRRNRGSWQRRPNPRIKGSASMEAIVGELGTAHSQSESYDPAMWAQDIGDALSDQGSFEEGSFEELIARCTSLSQQDVAVNFLRMLGLIQLVTKCQRYVHFLRLPSLRVFMTL